MKRFLLIISILSLFAAPVLSQSFNGGLIAGATFCQVDGDSYGGFHQIGLTGGVYVNRPVSEHFALQMELKYTQMGAHSDLREIEEFGFNPFNLRLHYAEIPLMLQYDFGHFTVNGKSLDFLTLEAGLSLDFRFRATEDVDGDYQVTTARWNFFSMTGNAGMHFAFNEHWGLGVRMMYSVIPCRFNGDPRWLLDHYYNRVIQATITYNINAPVR